MHGPTGIFWANLTPFSLQARQGDLIMQTLLTERRKLKEGKLPTWADVGLAIRSYRAAVPMDIERLPGLKVRETPSWPRSWANSSLF